MHIEQQLPRSIHYLLREVEHLMARSKEKDLGHNTLFSHEVQRLHGCGVGFMIPEEFQRLCTKYKLDAKACELMFVQTGRRSVPHVPLTGGSALLPLGAKHGYASSRGAIYRGKYHPRDRAHELAYAAARPGDLFCTYPGDIYFFAPERAPTFSALSFTTPRLRQEDGEFNALHFPDSLVSIGDHGATVIL